MLAQHNFEVSAATYLGSEFYDQMNAVDVAPDGTIVVVGMLHDFFAPGSLEYALLGGGTATLVRMNETATEVKSITRLPGVLQDVQVSDDGYIAVCGSFGVGVLVPDASSFLWSDTTIVKGDENGPTTLYYGWYAQFSVKPRYKRATSRVSIGVDGTLATLQQNVWYGSPHMYVYNASGQRILDTIFPVSERREYPDRVIEEFFIHVYPHDICVDGINQSVIVGGWNPRMDDSRHMQNHPIHMPFIRTYSYDGDLKWVNYDWRAKDVYDSVDYYADSRINDLVLGRDGYLYATAYIHGGDHMFMIGPKEIKKDESLQVGYDNYSIPHMMGAGIDHAYICQYDPESGDMVKGQAVLVRKKADGSGQPNQSVARGIMADEQGRVMLAGYAQPFIKNRHLQTINGIPVGQRDTSEAFIMIVNPDWRSREIYTVVTKDRLEGAFWGLAYRNGVTVAAGEVFAGEAITTENALQAETKAGYDGYVIAWGDYEQFPVFSPEVPEHSSYPSGITLFPRTTSGQVTLSSSDRINAFVITNMQGHILRRQACSGVQSLTLDLSSFASGVYLIEINTDKQRIVERVVRQ